MNKLEEQKGKEFVKLKHSGEKWQKLSLGDGVDWWSEGFDAAIVLDLPIKFTEWKDDNFHKRDDSYYPSIGSICFNSIKMANFQSQDKWELEDVYKYWIDNIYKSKV